MANLYHLYLTAPGLAPDDPELTKKLDLATDWLRFGDNCWLLYTTGDAAKWYARLGALVKKRAGHMFIIKVDPSDRQGWLPKSSWKWIQSKTYG